MFPIKFAVSVQAVLCSSCILVSTAYGGDSPIQAFEAARRLEAKVMNGELVGWEQSRLVHLKCGTNEMVFTVPHGLRAEAAESKVTLTAPEAAYFVSFRIRAGTLNGEKAPDQETARKRLLDQYAGAKIVDEYQAAALARTGRAYELRWTPAGVGERLMRIAQIPTEAGTVELTLVAEPGKSAEGTFAFNSVLTTLCKAQDGKFEIVRATGGS